MLPVRNRRNFRDSRQTPRFVNLSLSCRRIVRTQYTKESRISNALSPHFPFPLRLSRKRMSETFEEFPGLRDDFALEFACAKRHFRRVQCRR